MKPDFKIFSCSEEICRVVLPMYMIIGLLCSIYSIIHVCIVVGIPVYVLLDIQELTVVKILMSVYCTHLVSMALPAYKV